MYSLCNLNLLSRGAYRRGVGPQAAALTRGAARKVSHSEPLGDTSSRALQAARRHGQQQYMNHSTASGIVGGRGG